MSEHDEKTAAKRNSELTVRRFEYEKLVEASEREHPQAWVKGAIGRRILQAGIGVVFAVSYMAPALAQPDKVETLDKLKEGAIHTFVENTIQFPIARNYDAATYEHGYIYLPRFEFGGGALVDVDRGGRLQVGGGLHLALGTTGGVGLVTRAKLRIRPELSVEALVGAWEGLGILGSSSLGLGLGIHSSDVAFRLDLLLGSCDFKRCAQYQDSPPYAREVYLTISASDWNVLYVLGLQVATVMYSFATVDIST